MYVKIRTQTDWNEAKTVKNNMQQVTGELNMVPHSAIIISAVMSRRHKKIIQM